MKLNRRTTNMLALKWPAGILTALFLFFASAGFAQDREYVNTTAVDDFNEWDADANEVWDTDEFNNRIADVGFYNNWDTDDDGLFSNDEVNEGLFNEWDEDDDGYLTNDEYASWNTAWGGEYEDEWDAWDVNNDDVLDYNEYNTGVTEAGVFNDWDTDYDGFYSEDEFNEGLYNTWDVNDDGFLGYDEYGEYGYNWWGI